jgi:glutamyl-tRNA reductase
MGMDRVGLLGVSWRHATAATLAQYTLPRDGRGARLRALAAALEVDELVYVATCNRVEVLLAGGRMLPLTERRRRLHGLFAPLEPAPGGAPGPATNGAARTIRAWEGEGAVEHLFLMAAGLDSARAGESEITGQLRVAAAEAAAEGLCGPRLTPLLDDALRVARRVRPVTEGRIGRASLADVAVGRVLAHLRSAPGRVALVGISPMTQRCAAAFARAGVPLVVVNRTVERAAALAASCGAAWQGLDEFRAAPGPLAAMVLATGAMEPILDLPALQRIARAGARAPLVVDLGVPPNVRPDDARAAGVARLGMDAITEAAGAVRERALDELGEARALVDEALDERRRRGWEAMVDPVIVELRRRVAARARDEVDRALQDELASLDAAERAALRRWAEGLVQRLVHVPTRGLRDLAGRAGPAAAADFLGTTAPDLAAALRTRAAPWRVSEELP